MVASRPTATRSVRRGSRVRQGALALPRQVAARRAARPGRRRGRRRPRRSAGGRAYADARRHRPARPRLLGLAGTLGADGRPLIDGLPWDDERSRAAVHAAAGEDAELFDDGWYRFDVLPLLVSTDGAVAALGVDGRRLRPNIVIGGVEGLAER